MYVYEELKPSLFTERGSVRFMAIRDKAKKLISESGAARLQEIISGSGGDSWEMLACVDRLVELGEIREVTDKRQVAGQHRVFVLTGG